MKNSIRYIWGLLFCMFLGLSFVSCSDDDDDSVNPPSTIFGTWLCTDCDKSDDYICRHEISFFDDGTYMLVVKESYYPAEYSFGIFTYNPSTSTLTTTYIDDYDGELYTEIVRIKFISKNKFVVEDEETGENMVYIKQ